jgi:hypothetical protein
MGHHCAGRADARHDRAGDRLRAAGGGLHLLLLPGRERHVRPAGERDQNVRLPVTSALVVNPPLQIVDRVALTVLANNVAIPGQWPGNNEFEGSLAYFPRLGNSPADTLNGRVDGYGNNMIPLLEATFVPLCDRATGAGQGSRGNQRGGTGALTSSRHRCFDGVTLRPRGSFAGFAHGSPWPAT